MTSKRSNHHLLKIGKLIKDITAILEANYPLQVVAKKYANLLKQKEGSYRTLSTDSLADRITRDLRSVHNDVHLRVFNNITQHKPTIFRDSKEKGMEQYGFKSVELDQITSTTYINMPYGSQQSYEMASHAMNLAAHARYVIIDLRNNPGGVGEMGHFLASYFFEPGREVLYLDAFNRTHQSIQEYTNSFVPGRRLTNAKLYILTKRKTASASEGLAFAMQKLKRATIVGEATAGAGIAGGIVELPCHLAMFVPVKMVVAPGSKVGWEGTGVIPDIPLAGDPLMKTRELIRKDLLARQDTTALSKAVIQWLHEEQEFPGAAVLDSEDAVLQGEYSNGISIHLQQNSLFMEVKSYGEVRFCQLVKVAKGIYTVLNFDPDLRPRDTRVYVSSGTGEGKLEFTLKLLIGPSEVAVQRDWCWRMK